MPEISSPATKCFAAPFFDKAGGSIQIAAMRDEQNSVTARRLRQNNLNLAFACICSISILS